jgi:hypothetical protein
LLVEVGGIEPPLDLTTMLSLDNNVSYLITPIYHLSLRLALYN